MFELVVAGDEQAAQQFSDRRFRQGIDEDEAPRALEIGQSGRPAELFEFLLGHRPLALDKGGDDLAPPLIGKTDDGDLEHRRMKRKTAFDLDRRDILAAGNDHVVDAAGHEQIAIAVDEAGIAGEIPAIPQRLRVRVGPAPVTLEGFIAGQQRDDLAFLIGGSEVRRGVSRSA